MTPEEFRKAGHTLIDSIVEYMRQVHEHPVRSSVAPGDIFDSMASLGPGAGPTEWAEVWRDAERIILPGLTHWQSPNFFGYFPSNTSFPAILGELANAGFGVQGMLWSTSPACTEVEMRVLDWMAGLLGLPSAFCFGSAGPARSGSGAGLGGGVIQGTASEGVLVALLAARTRALQCDTACANRLVVYASDQAHSSVVKAAMIAGLAQGADDRRNVHLIASRPDHSLDADRLERSILEDRRNGHVPCFVCATLGTTSSTAFDPLPEIGALCRKHGLWLHVDAAHAGSACICPEFRWMLEGVEHADSFCVNPHKWLLTNFDCSLLWTRDRNALTSALSVSPEYLRNAATDQGVVDYRDWQIPLGRRFRALKLWFVLRCYGVGLLQEHIREHVRLATLFEEYVRSDERFEVVAPRRLNLVCFRLRGDDGPTQKLLERLNDGGRIFLTHTVLPGTGYVLRMCIGARLTTEEHVRAAWDEIRRAAAATR